MYFLTNISYRTYFAIRTCFAIEKLFCNWCYTNDTKILSNIVFRIDLKFVSVDPKTYLKNHFQSIIVELIQTDILDMYWDQLKPILNRIETKYLREYMYHRYNTNCKTFLYIHVLVALCKRYLQQFEFNQIWS